MRTRLYFTFQSIAVPDQLKLMRPFFLSKALSLRLRRMLISRSRMYFLMVELTTRLQGAPIVAASEGVGGSYPPTCPDLAPLEASAPCFW
jgi:hypothetical protein